MRMHHHHQSVDLLLSMINALQKNPLSFERWQIAYLERPASAQGVSSRQDLDHLLHTMAGDLEGEIVPVGERALYLFAPIEAAAAFQDLVDAVVMMWRGAIPAEVTVHRYNLFHDYKSVCGLLANSLAEMPIDQETEESLRKERNFPWQGQNDSLALVFEEAKRLRKSRSPARILIVDDDKLTCRLVARILKDDFVVYTAHDAEEAMVQYMLYAPEIVFLDIQMPEGNGFQVLKQIKYHDAKAYVVMLSGQDNVFIISRAMRTGAEGFITKPFMKDRFRYYISGAMAEMRAALPV
jgi:two-component system, chemotaxis family, chemotaxis protein CheY